MTSFNQTYRVCHLSGCEVCRVSVAQPTTSGSKARQGHQANELRLYSRAKALFQVSHNSLGSRTLFRCLREEGLPIGRYRARTIMRKLGLVVYQRRAYKVTTKRKHSDRVADDLLNQKFNPGAPDQIWAGDITYLRTTEGWLYLAVVMALYLRRIVGWSLARRISSDLIGCALTHIFRRFTQIGQAFRFPVLSY